MRPSASRSSAFARSISAARCSARARASSRSRSARRRATIAERSTSSSKPAGRPAARVIERASTRPDSSAPAPVSSASRRQGSVAAASGRGSRSSSTTTEVPGASGTGIRVRRCPASTSVRGVAPRETSLGRIERTWSPTRLTSLANRIVPSGAQSSTERTVPSASTPCSITSVRAWARSPLIGAAASEGTSSGARVRATSATPEVVASRSMRSSTLPACPRASADATNRSPVSAPQTARRREARPSSRGRVQVRTVPPGGYRTGSRPA